MSQTTSVPPAANEPAEEKSFFRSVKLDLFAWLQALVFALFLLIFCFTFFGRVISVVGSSMYPTLHDSDMLLVQSIGYSPQPGDVIVLTKEFANVEGPIVKRVIATGGQTVDIDYDAGLVYVDGAALTEPYINETMTLPGAYGLWETHVVVPENHVFVLGDNRNASADSRHSELGAIDERYILGKAICVVLPFSNLGLIPH